MGHTCIRGAECDTCPGPKPDLLSAPRAKALYSRFESEFPPKSSGCQLQRNPTKTAREATSSQAIQAAHKFPCALDPSYSLTWVGGPESGGICPVRESRNTNRSARS